MIPDGFGRTEITQRLIGTEISMNKFRMFRKSPLISRHLRFGSTWSTLRFSQEGEAENRYSMQ